MVCRFSDYERSVFHLDEFVTQGFAWGDTAKMEKSFGSAVIADLVYS